MEMRAYGQPKEGSQWRPGLVWPALDARGYLRFPPGKGPEASRLSTEPPETSEKTLPPGFPEAESLVSQDTSFWMKSLQPSEPLLAVALLLEVGFLVTGFQVFLGSAIEEVTSPPRGPFMGLTVNSPAHSPQDSDRSSG